MTTYPLSEPATAYVGDNDGNAISKPLFQGSLSECVAIVEGMPQDERTSASIKMDALDLSYGPAEVDELVRFLRDEDAGLSNRDIADVAKKIK
ncbi:MULTISPECIES: hypothetical protein [unclassified Sphingomonas]|jgi:hypothetical protein|uniref:hypothetical protein n=1 Tax=unclassified Sphingomonas TaxID=196159 RepID=UPI001620F38F|nr:MULTISPECIES: hypothetical protein [unclassified Sphingomonas]MBB3349120.1 hypothetical protein [Sphingomonas sp. BK069]MBB3475177.1 hypothetical protein [Sphingomonas sp. BK345]